MIDSALSARSFASTSLIHQEDFWVGQQSARDRQHLLLAAGELIAHIAEPLRKPREQLEYPRQCPMSRPRADVEVLAHRQRGKNLALLRHEAEAGQRAAVARHAVKHLSIQHDLA
jgi:hypothetical protein